MLTEIRKCSVFNGFTAIFGGFDSRIGRTAAVMLGSTETTFYVLAVYFGACGVRRSRWTIPAAIAADLTGFLAAAALVRWIWGA